MEYGFPGVRSSDRPWHGQGFRGIWLNLGFKTHNPKVSFLYPLFLLAASAVAIPLLLHLYNLRRYQKVYFSHSHYLRQAVPRTRKMARIRHWLLLLLRSLMILFLVLGYAQPLGSRQDSLASAPLTILYVDNSASMSLRSGWRTLLDIARESALNQLEQADPESSYLLLSHSYGGRPYPQPPSFWSEALHSLDFSSRSLSLEEVIREAEKTRQSQGLPRVDLWYYSDFRQGDLEGISDLAMPSGVRFLGVPVQPAKENRAYIDTAYLLSPVLKSESVNELVVVSRVQGDGPDEEVEMHLEVNGQRVGARILDFDGQVSREDTFLFPVRGSRWQEIHLSLQGSTSGFDQDYFVSARSMPQRRILHVYAERPNVYVEAAFRALQGFTVERRQGSEIPEDRDHYNLLVLEDFGRLGPSWSEYLDRRLEQGQVALLIPGRSTDLGAMNQFLRSLTPLQYTDLDTVQRELAQIQRGNPFVRDLFDQIPENVRLPTIHWHYKMSADFQSGQQALLSFSDGNPYLSRIPRGRGTLYLLGGGLDEQAGNFQTSYFFAPFLYQMARGSGSGDLYALELGSGEPCFLPANSYEEKDLIRLTGPELERIPRQRASGSGTLIYLEEAIGRPGFYTLHRSGADTVVLGANADRREFLGDYLDMEALKRLGEAHDFQWIRLQDRGGHPGPDARSAFPLWKLCVTLAGLMLLLETALLVRGSPMGKTIN